MEIFAAASGLCGRIVPSRERFMGLAAIRTNRARAILLAVVLMLPGLQLNVAAETTDSRKGLVDKERCALAASLKAVYERPSAVKERGPFLVMSVKGRPQAYVQCMFADNRKKLYCEASSGDYVERESKPCMSCLSQESVAALGRLGFAIGTGGKNYPYKRDLNGTPDFDAIATLMLSALHDAYGVREGTTLDTYAPFEGSIIVVCRM